MSATPPDRDRECAVLDEVLDRLLRTGAGGVVVVDGPPGCGRTTLLHAAVERAADRGIPVLRAVGSAAERPVPFGVVGQLQPDGAQRCPAVPADALVDPPRDGEAAVVDPAVRARAVHAVGSAVLERGPLLVAVDDAAESDDASLDWIGWVARRAGSAPVLLAVAAPGDALVEDLRRHPWTEELGVRPLTVQAVADRCGREGDPDAVLGATGGHPRLVHALLDDRTAGRTALPGPALVRATSALLDRLPTGAVATARALAVTGAGNDGDGSDIRNAGPGAVGGAARGPATAGVPDPGLQDSGPGTGPALAALEQVGLLRDGTLTAGVRDVVLAATPPAELRALRIRAARLRRDRGAPDPVVAALLLAAGGDLPPWSAPVLVRAADQALRDDRIDDARRSARAATEAVPLGDRDVALAAAACRARAEWRAGPAAAARQLTVQAASVGDLPGPELAPLLRRLLWLGRNEEATAVVDRLRAAPDAPDGDVGATHRWLARTHPGLAARGPVPLDTRRGPAAADPAAPPWTAVADALTAICTRDSPDSAVDVAEQALQQVRRRDPDRWWPEVDFELLLVLVYAGHTGAAVDRARRLRDAEPSRPGRALHDAVRAEGLLRLGDLMGSGEASESALAVVAPEDWGVAVGVPLGAAVQAATRSGRMGTAAELLARPVPDALFGTRYGLHYLHARGEYHLAAGRGHAALADFRSCGELAGQWGLDRPGLVPWRAGASAAWLRRDDGRSEARRLVQDQLAAVGPGPSRERGAALRLLAATGRASGREQVLDEAVAVLETAGDRYELARALADLARTHESARRYRRAAAVARRARQVAEDCGADALARALRARATSPDPSVVPVPDDPGPADPAGTLTPGERRVAALAAAGLTNREIAERLRITASTAEQHLTRVFRKLGVRDRTDLPADLQEHGATA